MKEATLQKQILDYLKLQRFIVFKHRSVAIHENEGHCVIARLGRAARTKAVEDYRSEHFPSESTVAHQRAFVRSPLKTELHKIDDLVSNC